MLDDPLGKDGQAGSAGTVPPARAETNTNDFELSVSGPGMDVLTPELEPGLQYHPGAFKPRVS